jgi:hypothetical protein
LWSHFRDTNVRLPGLVFLSHSTSLKVIVATDIRGIKKKLQCSWGTLSFTGMIKLTQLTMGYGPVYALQVFTHQHVCHCSPCFRFYILHIPFDHVSTFSMKHPQCNRHPVAHLQLERQSVASFGGDLVAIWRYTCNLALWCSNMVVNTREIVNVPRIITFLENL